jgi:phosphotransferase system HPr (HPr) family protein
MHNVHSTIVFECPVLLHLRPAGEIVKLVSKYDAVLTIHKEGTFAYATSVLDLIALSVSPGDEIRMTAVGVDADRMLDAVRIMLLTYTRKGGGIKVDNALKRFAAASA